MAAWPEEPDVSPSTGNRDPPLQRLLFLVAVWNHVVAWTHEDLLVSNFLSYPGSVFNRWDDLIVKSRRRHVDVAVVDSPTPFEHPKVEEHAYSYGHSYDTLWGDDVSLWGHQATWEGVYWSHAHGGHRLSGLYLFTFYYGFAMFPKKHVCHHVHIFSLFFIYMKI